ncbi:MAG: hypothetical protein GYB67_03280 [Chloroflexi bacterium]|nr:hypothetical protein [Chloroflexota bacterium]
MLLDWFAREGGIVLSWWALVTLAGAAALPLCARVLSGLPDRGYTLARAAGLLLVGFVYWLLASLGFLTNTTGNMALAWAIVLIGGVLVYFTVGRRAESALDWRAWWRENRPVVIVTEVLFLGLLVAWAIVRAHQNGLLATEKPMELAFISSVMRSENFPPNDPWLAGYAISYYYFGYVMAGMLSMLSGIPSTVGFNMMVALLFALTSVTAFGVGYNLVRSRAQINTRADLPPDDDPPQPRRGPNRLVALIVGLLALLFVTIMGNFQLALIEMPYQTGSGDAAYLSFWDSNLRQQPRVTGNGDPAAWDFWWWFRSARVLNDRNLDGSRVEVIDEFPQFSFLLGDVHPHVLALPFAVLALGLALNVLLSRRPPNAAEIVFYAICFGGLIFLNTWDGPIYLIALVGVEGLRRMIQNGGGRLRFVDWVALIRLGVTLLILAVVLYLPFWFGFRSQLSGILPNLLYPTYFPQFFVMFGPLLLILAAFLGVEVWRARDRMNWRLGVFVGGGLLLALVLVMLVLTVIGSLLPQFRAAALGFVDANGGWGAVLPDLLTKRFTHGLTALVLTIGLILVAGRLFPRLTAKPEDALDSAADDEAEPVESAAGAGEEQRQVVTYPPATGFALLLVAMGLVLTLVPEFAYLRDNFGTRMNTVFKFYYQTWLIFSIAGAYAVYTILADTNLREGARLPALPVRAAFSIVTVIAVTLGLLYPILGIHNRMFVETGRLNTEAPRPLTLDGGPTYTQPNDYLAALCLAQTLAGDDVVIVETVGPSYDNWPHGNTGISGVLVGLPVLLNWPGHQSQWRGVSYGEVVGTREGDIERLYSDPTWGTTREIIERYGIDYIFFGATERSRYGAASELKFSERFEPVCEQGESRYYRVDERALTLNP